MGVEDDADDLVAFEAVQVIRSTAPALLCRVGDRRVWLPRRHISGKLWCTGDRGKLLIRRWVARDRGLIDSHGAVAVAALTLVPSRRRPSLQMHVVRGDRDSHHAE